MGEGERGGGSASAEEISLKWTAALLAHSQTWQSLFLQAQIRPFVYSTLCGGGQWLACRG